MVSAAIAIPNSASKRGIKELANSYNADTNASKKLKMAAGKRSGVASAKTAKTGAGMDAAKIGALSNSQAYHRGMFLAFIDNAFAERRMARNEHYNELVSQFKAFSSGPAASTSAMSQTASQAAAPSTAQLRSWMEALTHVVAQLDRSHSVLVDAVVSLPWTSMEEPIAFAYTRFVQALLCSRSEFVQMTLEKIIKGFRFHSGNAISEDGRSNASSVTRRQSYERLHQLLSSLIYLIPTLPTALWPIVNRHFPHKRENRNAQVVYITNALRIVEYCPQLGENVLGAVILQAIQIDVEIQIDIDDLEDEEGALDEEVFGYSVENPFDRLVGDEDSDSDSEDEDGKDLDVDAISSDGDSEDEGNDTDDNKDVPEQNKEKVLSPAVLKRLKDMAAKLDAILRVVFDFLQRINAVSSAPPPRPSLPESSSFLSRDALVSALHPSSIETDTTRLDQRTGTLLRHTIFDVLLAIFDEKILRTFQTRHTQFLLFWFSSLSPEFTDHFTGNLIGRALDDQITPTVTRVAASGYVASFVSRAVSIDRVGARKVVSLLCTFLEDEMEELRFTNANMFNPGSAGTLNERIIKNSVVFYAACQATFYIFCFRWQDLLDENEEEIESLEGVPASRRWMADLDILKMAVNSPLNPLRMCAPTVVSQFARMAHKTDFMYCHSIIEANKRQSRSRRNTVVESPTSEVDPLPTPTLARPGSLPRTLSTPASSLVESVLVQQALKDAQIDSHFPFDPYKLPLSASYIHGIYRNWDSGGLDDDDDEDEDASDADDSESAATETGEDSSMASSSIDNSFTDNTSSKMFPSGSLAIRGMIDPALLNSDEEDFSKSFDAMSVSPRRPPLMSAAY